MTLVRSSASERKGFRVAGERLQAEGEEPSRRGNNAGRRSDGETGGRSGAYPENFDWGEHLSGRCQCSACSRLSCCYAPRLARSSRLENIRNGECSRTLHRNPKLLGTRDHRLTGWGHGTNFASRPRHRFPGYPPLPANSPAGLRWVSGVILTTDRLSPRDLTGKVGVFLGLWLFLRLSYRITGDRNHSPCALR